MTDKTDKTVKAAIILAVSIVLASLIAYMGLMHIGDSIQRVGQDIGLKIANKNNLRVELAPVELKKQPKE